MKREKWNREWLFTEQIQQINAEKGHSRDGERCVDLPHDFMVEKDVQPGAAAGSASGFYEGGLGFYTKALMMPEEWRNKCVMLECEGIYMNAVVEVNRNLAAQHHYGYTSFYADLTPYLHTGKENMIRIIVNNLGQPNCRWYTGSGIYRPVYLLTGELFHIAPWGIYVYTKSLNEKEKYAEVIAEITVENQMSEEQMGIIKIEIDDGKQFISGSSEEFVISPKNKSVIKILLSISNPCLWDTEDPHLYRVRAHLYQNGRLLDEDQTRLGIRTVSVDSRYGFRLNGKTIKLKGGCIHSDNGILGAASFKDSEYRKVRLHKINGFNAIRCSHNPPSVSFLDACDEMGILVLNELFDGWRMGKNANDYHLYFDSDWQQDMKSFVIRDRNHPSVIMWSIGNEVGERFGKSGGYAWSRQLADFLRSMDATRPVTCAVCRFMGIPEGDGTVDEQQLCAEYKNMMDRRKYTPVPGVNSGPVMDELWAAKTEKFLEPLDVAGYNYLEHRYEEDGQRYPERVICGTESFPMNIDYIWEKVLRLPYVIGDFCWTSYDYIGEAGVGNTGFFERKEDIHPIEKEYPLRLGNAADFDILGFERPQLAYRRIVWGSDETWLAVHNPAGYGKIENVGLWGWYDCSDCWTYPGYEGKPVEVSVYSRSEKVELFINGKSWGCKEAGAQHRYQAHFRVVYEPGELMAVSFVKGKERSRQKIETAGAPAKIIIESDRTSLPPDGESLAYLTITIADCDGVRVPYAEKKVSAEVWGAGTLAAMGSANPVTEENYMSGEFTSYQGRLMLIVRAGYEEGEIQILVKSGVMQSVCGIAVKNA